MRRSLVDYGILLLGAFLIWHMYQQGSKLNYAEETIQIQHEAIIKQNQYLEAQKRYILLLENQDPEDSYIRPRFL